MVTGQKGDQSGGEAARPRAAAQSESCADLALRLAGFRDKVEVLGKELDEFRKKVDELDLALSGPPAPPDGAGAPPVAAEPEAAAAIEQEDEGNAYLEQIRDQIHGLIHKELASMEEAEASSPPVAGAEMVCPSCGTIVKRAEEACPQCDLATESAPERGGRAFPLSAEKFLYVFNDRFGWFIKASDKAMYYADRKGDYEKAIDVLKVVVQFMEENLALLKSKHRDFKLALAYAYLGRCYFQSQRVKEAIEQYKKGILLKAGNSYNCEIGLTAVYRDLVRQIGETGKPLTPKSHPFLSRLEIEGLNNLGTRATA
jgi:tetratricopeptide (TPR) repeat protein